MANWGFTKRAKSAIIISATLLNIGPGKERATSALSQFAVPNQIKYLGVEATRLVTSLLFNGVATTDSNRCSDWAGGFFIAKKKWGRVLLTLAPVNYGLPVQEVDRVRL